MEASKNGKIQEEEHEKTNVGQAKSKGPIVAASKFVKTTNSSDQKVPEKPTRKEISKPDEIIKETSLRRSRRSMSKIANSLLSNTVPLTQGKFIIKYKLVPTFGL